MAESSVVLARSAPSELAVVNVDRRSVGGSGVLQFVLPCTTMPGKKLSDDWIHQSPEVTAAYSVCLDAEKCLVPQQPPIFALAKVEALERARALVKIRILGYLLVFGPTDTARKHVAGTILTEKEKGPEALIELGGYYEKYFLHPCKFTHHQDLPYGPTPKII